MEVEKIKNIGGGAFGEEYKARYNGKIVALKVFKKINDKKAREQFIKEIEYLSTF